LKVFKNSIIKAAKKAVPLKAEYKGQRNSCIWWNKDCGTAKKKYLRKKNEYEHVSTICNYIEVKRAYTAFMRAISQAKKQSWEEFIENSNFCKPVLRSTVSLNNSKVTPHPGTPTPSSVHKSVRLTSDRSR